MEEEWRSFLFPTRFTFLLYIHKKYQFRGRQIHLLDTKADKGFFSVREKEKKKGKGIALLSTLIMECSYGNVRDVWVPLVARNTFFFLDLDLNICDHLSLLQDLLDEHGRFEVWVAETEASRLNPLI